ncbi:MAG: hypothetical protein C0601_11875 [Candidatus Muiribacterium halophilum]|uniref:DUF1007 domain-containing protein n=1 Tax=Muiribacterium halophilum TaxID=2053465 RepID=A0A2N5ZB41_MUIH1|nr:MAG: hypothetical protein C0601_11875 [Candidatus Muirbacterium halophilum]
MNKYKALLLIISIFFFDFSIIAHPHVFVDVTTNLSTKDNNITAVQLLWYYDEMFSLTLFNDFNKNGDKEFSKDEVNDIREGIFKRMKDYGYYTHLYIDNKKSDKTPIFNAWLSDEKVVFSFLYKIDDPKPNSIIKVQIYDEEYYHAFKLLQDQVSFNGRNPSYSYKLKDVIKKLGFYEAEVSTLILEPSNKNDEKGNR